MIARQHCGFARRIVEVGDVTHDGPGAHRQVVDQAGASWPVSGKLGGTGQEKNTIQKSSFQKKELVYFVVEHVDNKDKKGQIKNRGIQQ